MSSALRHTSAVACVAALLSAAAFAGCGSSPQGPPASAPAVATPVAAAPVSAPASASAEAFDVCKGSPKVPHAYHGILRKARCEQDMFLTMADVADQLGTDCRNCHMPLVIGGKEDPKKEDYPQQTDRKLIANWMSMHLMQSLKTVSGEPMKCKLCHVDEHGQPVRKILGSPRDVIKAQEWMSLVMMTKFEAADGSKLKCKTCHLDNVGKANWQSKVILTDHLPPHVTP